MCWIQVHVATYKHTTYEYCVYMYTYIHTIRSCILCMRLYVLSYIQFVNMYLNVSNILYTHTWYMTYNTVNVFSQQEPLNFGVMMWSRRPLCRMKPTGLEHLEVKEAQRLVTKRNWVWGLPSFHVFQWQNGTWKAWNILRNIQQLERLERLDRRTFRL